MLLVYEISLSIRFDFYLVQQRPIRSSLSYNTMSEHENTHVVLTMLSQCPVYDVLLLLSVFRTHDFCRHACIQVSYVLSTARTFSLYYVYKCSSCLAYIGVQGIQPVLLRVCKR